MNALFIIIVVVQILAALAIICLVILQHGKGADMGVTFGSNPSGSFFSTTGFSSFLFKLTSIAAAIFFSSTLALTFFTDNLQSKTNNVFSIPNNSVTMLTAPATTINQSSQIPR